MTNKNCIITLNHETIIMGEFRERDGQSEPVLNSDTPKSMEEAMVRHSGSIEVEGIEEILSRMEGETGKASPCIVEPDRVLEDQEIDYEQIRTHAQYTYMVNSNNQVTTPRDRDLEIDIVTSYREMTSGLMSYLKEDGVNALNRYVRGDLEDDRQWVNLTGLGIIEGERELSKLGEYITEQVFEYSDQ